MDYALQRIENGGRWLWLLNRLDAAAASKEIFGDLPRAATVGAVVASKASIEAFWKQYVTALPGKTYICCGVSGAGKTTAAFYLLHGDLNVRHRPKRAIMIRQSDSTNLPLSFCHHHFGSPDAAPVLHTLLIEALKSPENRRIVPPKNLLDAARLVTASLARSCQSTPFETDLVRLMNANEMGASKIRPNCSDLPLLIVDGLSRSDANTIFISSLYEVAYEARVTVFVLVKDTEFANELCRLNGGRHILPCDYLINNPRGDNVGQRFTQTPDWNGMQWRLADIANFAAASGISNVELREGMTPGEVEDLSERANLEAQEAFTPDNT